MKRLILVVLALMLAVATLLGVIVTAGATEELQPSAAGTSSQTPQPAVSIHMSATPDGAEQTHFPSGTGTMYVTMIYTAASQTQIQVKMYDDTGIPILWEPVEDGQPTFRPYVEYVKTDSGSELITVSGDRVFLAYFHQALSQGASMQENIDKALDSWDQGRSIAEIQGHVQAAVTAGTGFNNALTRLRDDYVIGADVSEPVNNAIDHLVQALSAAAEALDSNLSDRDALRNHILLMQTSTNQAVTQATQAQTAAGTGASYALLDTRPCQQNLTRVWVDDLPSSSIGWTVRETGSAARIEMSAHPLRIYAKSVTAPGAVHSTTVQATVMDDACIPVNPTGVQFTTIPDDPRRGTVDPIKTTTVDGMAVTTLTAGEDEGDGALGVRATAQFKVFIPTVLKKNPTEVKESAPSLRRTQELDGQRDWQKMSDGATEVITVTVIGPSANMRVRGYKYIAAIGGTQTDIQVDITDKNRQKVADGTEVTFSLDPATMGQWDPASVTTTDGEATSKLTSGGTRGSASVVATADGVTSDPFPITFVGPPASMEVIPDPASVVIIGESAHSEIGVVVLDDQGEKAPDGTEVIFDANPAGLAVFSPNNQANLLDGTTSRTLQLLSSEQWPPGVTLPITITVTATAGEVSGQSTVVFYEEAQ